MALSLLLCIFQQMTGENVDTSRNEAFGIFKSKTSDNYEGYDSLFTHANKADNSGRF